MSTRKCSWEIKEIALMLLLVEACNKKYSGISGYYNGKIHTYLPFYKRFNMVASLLNRSMSATRRKYNKYITKQLNKDTLIDVDKEVKRMNGTDIKELNSI